jgi:hypothetical protein
VLTFPIVTDAPAITAPLAARTTPDTVAVAFSVGPSPPHAATRIDVSRAMASVRIVVEDRAPAAFITLS